MAKKRMISADLLDNDVFLDLSISAKALYFYLILKADDDGIVAKPKSVVREIQATNEDLKALIDTRYILSFPSGVICVKHWKMHNSIPKDRYKPTTYQEELSTLIVRDDGSYTEMDRYKKPKDNQNKEEPSRNIEPYNHASIYVEEYWRKITDLYPNRNGLTTAHQYYLDKFLGISFDNMEELAKIIYEAVKLYLLDVKDKYHDKKFVLNLDNWFKRDYDEYMRKAREELEKQVDEGEMDDEY